MMSSKKFLSQALSAVSTLAVTGFLFHTSVWAMDDKESTHSGLPVIQSVQEKEPKAPLPTSPSRTDDDAILSRIHTFAINKPRAPDFAGTFNPEGKFVPEDIGGRAFFVDRPNPQFKFYTNSESHW